MRPGAADEPAAGAGERASEKSGAVNATPVATPIVKAVQLYRSLGFSDARAAAVLARSGYPAALIQAQYPALPMLPTPVVRRVGGEGGAAPLSAGTLLARVGVHRASGAVRAEPLKPQTPIAAVGEAISFQFVPLIQCSFPHADPRDLGTFTRRNGWLELTLSTARRDVGLPYGVPARLLTIYCASEAIRTRSPEIFLGESVNEFLRRLDIPITRGARGSQRVYANQLLRLIHCSMSIDENIRDASGRTGLHIRQALFAEEARLWWDAAGVGQGSSLILSATLFESILERSAPLSSQAIKQLRKSPMDLDVYAWLVHRLYHLSAPSTISWAQLSGQFGHGYAEPRKFRHFFLDSLKRVQAVYQEARLKVGEAGVMLLPSKPHVAPSTRRGGALAAGLRP